MTEYVRHGRLSSRLVPSSPTRGVHQSTLGNKQVSASRRRRRLTAVAGGERVRTTIQRPVDDTLSPSVSRSESVGRRSTLPEGRRALQQIASSSPVWRRTDKCQSRNLSRTQVRHSSSNTAVVIYHRTTVPVSLLLYFLCRWLTSVHTLMKNASFNSLYRSILSAR